MNHTYSLLRCQYNSNKELAKCTATSQAEAEQILQKSCPVRLHDGYGLVGKIDEYDHISYVIAEIFYSFPSQQLSVNP